MNDKQILITIISSSILIYFWLYSKYKKEQQIRNELFEENKKLIASKKMEEAKHLKYQLQPHTLRNMVATLHVASKNLYKGSEALAETLDYVLYNGAEHFVSVQEEINFLETYKSLQGNFVYQINSIKIDKSAVNENSPYFYAACLPHLVTAYFIENAFKHGDVNHPEFLNISLTLSEKYFRMDVVNRISKKPLKDKGGLGLINMEKRLSLLLPGKYEIKKAAAADEYQSSLTINF